MEKDLRANFPRSLNLILIPPQFNSPHPTTTTYQAGGSRRRGVQDRVEEVGGLSAYTQYEGEDEAE